MFTDVLFFIIVSLPLTGLNLMVVPLDATGFAADRRMWYDYKTLDVATMLGWKET